jgi:Ca2+-transporting ATPase
VTAAIASGGGTLGGSATAATNASGIATFTNLSINGTAGARTLTFTTLIIANLGLIFANRSWARTIFEGQATKNTALIVVVASTVIVLAAVLYVPFFQELFHFRTLHPVDVLICLVAGMVSLVWFERLKTVRKIGEV